ncbi:MAG: lipase maturation factor family protein, partial [Gammaproteobacteria bacterium]|nr:lipase maturation factor family protein [Gammaproteobacteria bacterium]
PWTYNLVFRLLDAEPTVLDWIDDPFGGERPRFVRILSYHYEFTRPNGMDAVGGGTDESGRWWTRSDRRLWLPRMVRRVPRVTHEPLELP